MSIGRKIKNTRTQLGMTQKQLAGTEMTRAFISLIESGKSVPSFETLSIIAERLGKPVDFFLINDDYSPVVESLLRYGEQELDHKPQHAKEIAHQAVQVSKLLESQELQAEAHLLQGHTLFKTSEYDLALEDLEQSLFVFESVHNRVKSIDALLLIGNCYFALENYRLAKKYYNRLITLSSGLKSQQLKRFTGLVYLASCELRLGDAHAASAGYTTALEELSGLNETSLQIQCMLGLGWANYQLSNLDAALNVTRNAIVISVQHRNYLLIELEHNLAIFESKKGNWQEAYALWSRCLKVYKERNNMVLQAAVLEEICNYWMWVGNMERAEACCWTAIQLLDKRSSSLQRGRLYRVLGDISREKKNIEHALNLYQLAIGFFTQIGSAKEIQDTVMKIKRTKEQSDIAMAKPSAVGDAR